MIQAIQNPTQQVSPVVSTSGERIPYDYYPTPEPITHLLLESLPELIHAGVILEPCSGEGAIAQVLRRAGAELVIESDIRMTDDIERDATKPEFWQDDCNCLSWVVTNPPFNVADKILPHAFDSCTRGCAFLLRLSYLEPTRNRAEWLQESADHLRFVIPVSPRVKFRKDVKGSDSVTCAWFVWDKQWSWGKRGISCPFVFASGWR